MPRETDSVLEPGAPTGEVGLERVELRLGRGEREARAQAEGQPPFADQVDGRRLVQDEQWVPHRGEKHRRPEPDQVRAGRDRGEERQRVVPGPGERAVSHPDRVETCGLRVRGEVERRRGGRSTGEPPVAGGEEEPDAHGVSPSGGRLVPSLVTEPICL